MDQIKKIVEVGCRGIVKDTTTLSDIVTREEKDVYLVYDAKCPTYSFLMILSDKKREKKNRKNLGLYAEVFECVCTSSLSLDGIFTVKNHHSGGYEAVYLWSASAIEATILYCLGLRVWKKISSDRGDSPSVNSVLGKLRKTDIFQKENVYNIRSGMESLPYGKDVKIISLGTPGSLDLSHDEHSYVIAEKIAEANRDMYFRHDSAFDEMHKIAKIFGLSLPTSPDDWNR